MTDDQKRQEEINRAAHAEAVLKNPLVKEVLDRLEADIVKAWEGTNPRDQEARERGWMFYVTVRKFRNQFLSYIETGKMASVQLEEKRRFQLFSRGK